MAAPVNTKDFMKQELIRSAEDPVYFLKNYARIVHPTRGKIPFKTYQFQDECIKHFIDHRFNIVLKSRQLGLSTITAGFATWFAMFNRDKSVLVIATKLDVAQNFIKKVKTIIDNLPPWWSIIKVVGESKKSITLSNGSTITAIPTSEDAGRSEALSLLIVDEAAIIKDFEDVWTGLFPTISAGGRAILLSTPKGAAGQFYEIWQQAINGENGFNPIKLMWSVHPEHDENWLKTETRGWSPRKVAQEYLCDFNASGETFLQIDEMEWLRSQVSDPIDRWGFDNNIWVWERPIPGEKYLMSADVSRGNAEDSSTFHVFRDSTSEVVAEYKGKLPPDEFGKLMFDTCVRYNGALACPENNTFGYAAIRAMKLLGYKNFYYEGKRPGYIPMTDKEMPGFSTQKTSREKILTNLEKCIRNKSVKTHSERLNLEFKTFVFIGTRPRAQNGANDDLIMSFAIGAYLLDPTAGSSQNDDYTAALLGAMSVTKRDTSHLDMGQNVKPLNSPIMMSALPRPQYAPGTRPLSSMAESMKNLPNVPHIDPNDTSWVTK